MRTPRLLTTVFTLLASDFAAAQSPPPSAVWVATETGTAEAQGFFVDGARGCVLVTAGHVVHGADYVQWRIDGSAPKRGRVSFAQKGQVDIAFVEPIDPPPTPCAPAPTADAIAGALRTSSAEFFKASPSGARRRIQVLLIEDQPELIVRPVFADEDVSTGTSGAALFVNQVLVGLVAKVDNSTGASKILIQRLDRLPTAAAVWLVPPAPPQDSTRAVWPPFDLEQLPADIRAVAEQAREKRRLAEKVAERAKVVERKADEAAAIGRANGNAGYPFATFFSDSGAEYAGGVYKRPAGGYNAHGYGVATFVRGDRTGQVVKCIFDFKKDGACDSEGVSTFADADMRQRWEGRVCDAILCGLGVLTFRDGNVWFYDPTQRSPGVALQRKVDGEYTQRIEGMIDKGGIWNGLGVMWNEQSGEVQHIGVWKNGKLVTDRAADLIRR